MRSFGIAIGACLFCLCTYSAIVVYFGHEGARSAFSPDTLQTKGQTEYLLSDGTAIYRSVSRYYQFELVDYLIAKGYWSARQCSSPQWISMFHWNCKLWKSSKEAFLFRNLFMRHNEWRRWTEINPDQAAQFWPEVLVAIRAGDVGREKVSNLLFQQLQSDRFEQ